MSDRSLSTKNPAESASATSDLVLHGPPDFWECISKASSEDQGWMKSTKRAKVEGGWLYQVTTEHRADGRVVACAEAITFVPSVDTRPR